MKSGFSSKANAIAALNELQVTKVAGTYVEPSKLTVGDYLKLWVVGGWGGVRPWTLRGYKAVVRVHLLPRIAPTRLQNLSRSEIKALYGKLRQSGFGRNPSPEHLQHLRQIAVRYQELRQGPSPRSAARVLVGETGHPEVTVRHWIRRCRELGMLPGSGPAPGTKGLSAKSVWNIHICLRAALNDAVEDAKRPVEEPDQEGARPPHPAVRPVHRRRVDPDQDLVLPRRRLCHVLDPEHLRRPVAVTTAAFMIAASMGDWRRGG